MHGGVAVLETETLVSDDVAASASVQSSGSRPFRPRVLRLRLRLWHISTDILHSTVCL
jgi:hypothetical protein